MSITWTGFKKPKRRYTTKGKGLTTQVKKLKSDVRMLKTSDELKWIPVTGTTDEVNYDNDFTVALFPVPQGDTAITREGDVISPHHISIKGRAVAGTTAAQQLRVMLVRSKQRYIPLTTASSGSTQAILQLVNSAHCLLSPPDRDNHGHFQIIRDFRISLYGGLETDTKFFSINYKCPKSSKIAFDQDTTVPESGQYYLLFWSNVAIASAGPIIDYYVKSQYRG